MCEKKNKKYVGKCIIEVNEKVKSQFFSLSHTLAFYHRSINIQISHDIVKVVVFLQFLWTPQLLQEFLNILLLISNKNANFKDHAACDNVVEI